MYVDAMMNFIEIINFDIFALIWEILKDDIQNMFSSLHHKQIKNAKTLNYQILDIFIDKRSIQDGCPRFNEEDGVKPT